MAAIDSILRVMQLRDAEAMTLASGQVPSLRRGGTLQPLSMPALDPGMVAAFVAELVPASARGDLDARGSAEVMHRSADGASFGVLIEKTAAGYKLLCRRAAARPEAPRTLQTPPPSPPPPASVSASVPDSASVSVSVPDSASVSVPDSPAPVLPASLASLISHASSVGASDLLLSSSLSPRLRIDGDLASIPPELDHPVPDADLLSLLSDPDRRDLDERGSADFAAEGPDGRLRVNVFRHHGGVAAALRLVKRRVPTARDLRLPDDLTDAVRHSSGLVLVCGPAGSGKSTTLVALVEHLNRTRARHVITLEDPIEYQYAPRRCLIHQREIGVHAATFADGLRAALRESPDVIVVGELRDRDTIAIALTAAETGHLVLGTLHAPGGAVAIDRIIDVFPEHQQRQIRVQLASTLRVILTQYLLPTRTGGRVPALERVHVTPAVATLIRKSELHMLASAVQSGRDSGMIPLERSLARLVKDGVLDAATARAAAQDLDLFEQIVRGRAVD